MATIKLKFVVEQLSNVLLNYDQIKVYRSTTGIDGAYSEITGPGTRVDLDPAVVLYEYIDTAGDPSYWYKFSYFNSVSTLEGGLSTPISGEDSGGLYASIQDLRDEGITVAMLSDARAMTLLAQASTFIDRVTGRWFEPRNRTFRVRSPGTKIVYVGAPIIQVTSVASVFGRGTSLDRESIDVDDVLVYNRHLTEGLVEPDDRDTPRIELIAASLTDYPGAEAEFLAGSQVIEVAGVFGYTELAPGDPVGESSDGSQVPLSYGSTPDGIKRACMLLVARNLGTLGDPATRREWRDGGRIIEEKTADQSYKLEGLGAIGQTGTITGDPEIDGLLNLYKAPPMATAV